MHIDGDEERARVWIEEVFAQWGEPITLYTPNRKALVAKLLKRLRIITRRKKRAHESLQKELADLQAAFDSVTISSETERIRQRRDEVEKKIGPAGSAVMMQDIEDDDEVIEMLAAESVKLVTLLKLCVKHDRIEPLRYGVRRNTKTGARERFATTPITLITGSNKPLDGGSLLQLLCESLIDGIVLCDLFNIVAGVVAPHKKVRVWRASALDSAVNAVTDTVNIADDVVAGSMAMTSTAASAGVNFSDKAMAATVATASKTASFVPDAVGGSLLEQSVTKVDALQQQTVGRATNATSDAVGKASMGAANRTPTASGLIGDTWTVLSGGPDQNIRTFCAAIIDPECPFKISKDDVFEPSDLINYDRGGVAEQDSKQARVLACVLEVAFQISHLDGYSGPKLDEVNLGSLGPNDFFGELSLLPLQRGWHHRRSVTSVQNALLYSISKQKVERLGQVFPQLQRKLSDHAEDYEKTIAATNAAKTESSSRIKPSAGESANKTGGSRVQTTVEHDPVMHVQEQLHQQDVKLSGLDLKFSEQDASMRKLNDKVDKMMGLLEILAANK